MIILEIHFRKNNKLISLNLMILKNLNAFLDPHYIHSGHNLLPVFLRKFYCTIRVFSTYVGFIIPLAILIAGALILETSASDIPKDL